MGDIGEEAASRYLKKQRWRIIERNWRTRLGEIDIVAYDGTELVLVEVKSRTCGESAVSYLFDTVTPEKQHKLSLLSELYLRVRFRGRTRPPVRIDVIGVVLTGRKKLHAIMHLRAAVSATPSDPGLGWSARRRLSG